MNHSLPAHTLRFFAFCYGSAALAAPAFYPSPELADPSTGLIESYVAGDWYRGSGVIARDPRLIYSCAHVFFEGGKWATDYYFYRAYHKKNYPEDSEGASPRGFRFFTSYSSGVKAYGSESNQAFSSDFTVLYGNSGFGNAVGWWPDGGEILRSDRFKQVVGYPSEIDFTGAAGNYYQHATEWFDYRAFKVLGAYHEYDDVSTGSGNSGGPVFGWDEETEEKYLAGILVSGTDATAGVRALDLSTHTLAGYALGMKPKSRVFKNGGPFRLPDGSSKFSTRSIVVSGFSGSVEKLKLNINVSTARRGDLEVYLKSPSGRVRWITRRSGGNLDNLRIQGADFTSSFSGQEANGKWEIWMRDTAPGVRATFQNASITLSAL